MITKKELGFVNGWAIRVPYPGMDYANITAEKLIEAFDDYNKLYFNKEYDIVLSNGDQVLFEILSKNLCHMLGIDYKNLSGDYFEKFRNEVLGISSVPKSYELLKIIIDNIDKVLEYDYNNSGKVLNYYRVMIKCSIFEKLSDFSRFNFGVINFDRDKYMANVGCNLTSKSEKYLYVQTNEVAAPFFMMGILRDNTLEFQNNEKFVVETLLAPDNVKYFFKDQEVAIPTQILVTTEDSMDKYEASPSDKIALLNQYRSIITKYELSNKLNIYSDYESILVDQEQANRRQKIMLSR